MHQETDLEINFLLKDFDKRHSQIHRILMAGLISTVASGLLCLCLVPSYYDFKDTPFLTNLFLILGVISFILALVLFILSIAGVIVDKEVFNVIELAKKLDSTQGYMIMRPKEVILFSNTPTPFVLPLGSILLYEMSNPNNKGQTKFTIHISPKLTRIMPLTSGYGIEIVMKQLEAEKVMNYINTVHIEHFKRIVW